jgi:hypothetical protein
MGALEAHVFLGGADELSDLVDGVGDDIGLLAQLESDAVGLVSDAALGNALTAHRQRRLIRFHRPVRHLQALLHATQVPTQLVVFLVQVLHFTNSHTTVESFETQRLAPLPIEFRRPVLEVLEALDELLRRVVLHAHRLLVGFFDGHPRQPQHVRRVVVVGSAILQNTLICLISVRKETKSFRYSCRSL